MFDIEAAQNRKINKLKEWRNRYSKEDYPYKVILNMFYELFSIELIWDEINSAFSGRKQFNDSTQALMHIGEIKRQIQISQVHQNLESFLSSDKVACGVKYSDFKEMVNKAQNGDNHKIVEIEYSYWFYCQYWEAVLEWAAYGLLGYDKHSAFKTVTGGDVGGLKLDTFKDTIQFFPTTLGVSFAWKDADGNSINPMSSKDKNKKYYPDSFEFLPPLWHKTSRQDKKSGCFVATVVYGDYNSDEVIKLRLFRDEILRNSILGKGFISIYYFVGPLLAKLVNYFKLNKPVKKILDYLIFRIDK
jgi:hypothetical protein